MWRNTLWRLDYHLKGTEHHPAHTQQLIQGIVQARVSDLHPIPLSTGNASAFIVTGHVILINKIVWLQHILREKLKARIHYSFKIFSDQLWLLFIMEDNIPPAELLRIVGGSLPQKRILLSFEQWHYCVAALRVARTTKLRINHVLFASRRLDAVFICS